MTSDDEAGDTLKESDAEFDETATLDRDAVQSLVDEQSQNAYMIVISGPRTGEMLQVEQESLILGRDRESVDVWFDDSGVSRQHARILQRASRGVIIEDLDSLNGTFVNGERIDDATELDEGDKVTLGSTTILKFTVQDDLDAQFQRQLYQSSVRDQLTGAYTKAYLLEQLDAEMSFANRAGRDVGLVLLDIDHFKQVNDNYGHIAGDQILEDLADTIRRQTRNEDLFARYGGEEFAVMTRETGLEETETLAERIRRVIEQKTFIADGEEISITVSVGLTTLMECSAKTPENFIDASDDALYEAKQSGRNCVRVYSADDFEIQSSDSLESPTEPLED